MYLNTTASRNSCILLACLCALLIWVGYAPVLAADEPEPLYKFVETDDALLADYLTLVGEHVAALPVPEADPLPLYLDMIARHALDLPTSLNDDELAELKEKHANDPRLPQLEYFVRACREWKYGASLGLDPQSMLQDPSAEAWQPLMDAYNAGTADGDTLYILQPHYFARLGGKLESQLAALPDELTGEERTAAIGKLLTEKEVLEKEFFDRLVYSETNNSLFWFAEARYFWSLGEVEDAMTDVTIGCFAEENYWPEPFPLSDIDDCLERGEIPVPPGMLPVTDIEKGQALAAVGAICELTDHLGIDVRDTINLKAMAKEGELMLAMSGDPYYLDWLSWMYQRMGEARRGGFMPVGIASVSCTICSNAMLMYSEDFDYREREALISASGVSSRIVNDVQSSGKLLWWWYPNTLVLALGPSSSIDILMRYAPDFIDSDNPGVELYSNRIGEFPPNPTARLAGIAKGRLAELAVCQSLRPQFERCLRSAWEEGQ